MLVDCCYHEIRNLTYARTLEPGWQRQAIEVLDVDKGLFQLALLGGAYSTSRHDCVVVFLMGCCEFRVVWCNRTRRIRRKTRVLRQEDSRVGLCYDEQRVAGRDSLDRLMPSDEVNGNKHRAFTGGCTLARSEVDGTSILAIMMYTYL
jgi:hypothetical protein